MLTPLHFEGLAAKADITLHVEEDRIGVRGNAIASGDDAYDKKVEDQILADLDSGNVWAWCTVEVRATLGPVSGSDHLGGCSYASEEDFRAEGDYFAQMVETAREQLAEELRRVASILELN